MKLMNEEIFLRLKKYDEMIAMIPEGNGAIYVKDLIVIFRKFSAKRRSSKNLLKQLKYPDYNEAYFLRGILQFSMARKVCQKLI